MSTVKLGRTEGSEGTDRPGRLANTGGPELLAGTGGAGDADVTTAHAAALTELPGMTPVRLARILDGFQPLLAWRALCSGTHPADCGRNFMASARATDVAEVGARYADRGVRILLPGRAGYPSMLRGDPGAPAVLFALGDPGVLEHRARVAIVGTRSATHYGRRVASELASDLASEGVVVVSGLALGIDGAAHAGAVRTECEEAGPPVAVVGTGLDEVYPAINAKLWEEVSRRGAVLSESALGTKPHPRVFPARNRIIAALSDVVVIVECHRRGGSIYTAEAAARRSIPVCVVPGSVMSPASEGTNSLLADGCVPVRDADDVLVAISLARAGTCGDPVAPVGGTGRSAITKPTVRSARTWPRAGGSSHRRTPSQSSMTEEQRVVWNAIDNTPTAFETILLRTDLSIASAGEVCEQLVEAGALLAGAGWWSRGPIRTEDR